MTNTTYDDNFYSTLNQSSETSADVYIKYLFQFINPKSVIDVGCGYASWLKACKKYGSSEHTGVDGLWNDGSIVKSLGFNFIQMDLDEINRPIKHHDLAICLEVAEHLKPSSSRDFIKNLTKTANVILFSAAFTNQGGTHHINERDHSFWGGIFKDYDYVAFDMFRENFWRDERVGFWYRQNCFLYCKKDTAEYRALIDNNIRSIDNLEFLDCVHPNLYMTKCGEGISFFAHLKGIIPSFFKAIKRILTNKR